jgi:pimeloyl-ACP methyl ester carboxylesterase
VTRLNIALPLVLALALLLPAGASARDPFGHPCTAQNGVRFCPTQTDADRVPSWDRVPLDVDVTLPATGKGPFPTIVMMHGWGGNKGSFEADSPEGGYNNVFYARRGYAVITPTARGFGRSCGAEDSRTAPGCDRGWVRLADHRYEGRDVQHLLGLLVDQKVVDPKAIGVTGVSYGGIQSLNLARLRDRIRLGGLLRACQRAVQRQHPPVEGTHRRGRARDAGDAARGARADRLPQHRRGIRRAGPAARPERLDRRPLPGARGAARLAHVPPQQGRAGGAPAG